MLQNDLQRMRAASMFDEGGDEEAPHGSDDGDAAPAAPAAPAAQLRLPSSSSTLQEPQVAEELPPTLPPTSPLPPTPLTRWPSR